MSKAFAFAGARVGYLAADPAVSDALRLVRLPYHLSSLTQAAACAAIAHAPTLLATVDAIKEQRDRIVEELPALGLRAVPSDANFVLFGGLDDEQSTWAALLERGVLVRDVGLPGHLRVTAGTRAETTAFLAALAAVGSGSRRRGQQGERVSRRSAGGRVGVASRATTESRVEVELDLDGTGASADLHRRAVLRPHAHRALDALADRPDGRAPQGDLATSTPTTRSRTSPS